MAAKFDQKIQQFHGIFFSFSFQPNCYAKIITIDGEKKIVIYSKQTTHCLRRRNHLWLQIPDWRRKNFVPVCNEKLPKISQLEENLAQNFDPNRPKIWPYQNYACFLQYHHFKQPRALRLWLLLSLTNLIFSFSSAFFQIHSS